MDEQFMRAAIALSFENVRHGSGGPFGAVVVKDGRIIATGVNVVTSSNDPTAHAEIVAIRKACQDLQHFQLSGCELYTSCEPCPMCLGAIYWARPDCIYFANTRSDAAAIGFDDAAIYAELALDAAERRIPMRQLLREEALEAFRAWEQSSQRVGY